MGGVPKQVVKAWVCDYFYHVCLVLGEPIGSYKKGRYLRELGMLKLENALLVGRFVRHFSFDLSDYAQFTLTLPPDEPPHVGWERVRAWVRSYFVRQEQLAALMVLHLPYLADSSNASHIHILLPARRLSVNGFTGHARDVCSDSGCHDAWNSWLSFHKECSSCVK